MLFLGVSRYKHDEFIPHYSITQLTYFLKWHVEYFLTSLETVPETASKQKYSTEPNQV